MAGAPQMMVKKWMASVGLAPYVESYGFRSGRIAGAPVYMPLPARRDCFLEFYLEERYRVVEIASGSVHRAPRCVLVGPHTQRREDLLLGGTLAVFSIRFSPIGFRALFGIPARLIADGAFDAAEVLGREIADLADILSTTVQRENDLCVVADRFLMAKLANTAERQQTTAMRIARMLQHPEASVAAVAVKHQVSVRQVERIFAEHVGVAPKAFQRLVRMERALKLGSQVEVQNWADISAACGYFDQSHMVRDFREMTGETPTKFAALRAAANRFDGRQRDVAFVLSGGVVSSPL